MSTEIATHGEPGPSGTRGSVGKARELGMGYNLGHFHTPRRRSLLARLWDHIRGRKVSFDFESGDIYAGFAASMQYKYSEHPSKWGDSQILMYEHGAREHVTLGELAHYCMMDVHCESEAWRVAKIIYEQPAARLDEGNRIVYDSWYWTGRTK